jgi:hypothetical protein
MRKNGQANDGRDLEREVTRAVIGKLIQFQQIGFHVLEFKTSRTTITPAAPTHGIGSKTDQDVKKVAGRDF